MMDWLQTLSTKWAVVFLLGGLGLGILATSFVMRAKKADVGVSPFILSAAGYVVAFFSAVALVSRL